MPRTSPYEIRLSPAEREELESLVRKYTAPYQEVIRAKIILMASEGYTNSEIAARMYISPRTVETHRANLQTKLGVTGRPELVRYALEHGVIHR